MGSIRYEEEMSGSSMKDAFREAQRIAQMEYGDDIYNGKINNAQGFRDVTSLYRASKLNLTDFIDQRCNNLSKFEVGEAICLEKPIGNINKVKSQVDHIVTKGTKKWLLLYEVNPTYISCYECPKSFPTKGEAVKYARQLAEKYQADFSIKMVKKLDKIDPLVAKVSYKKSKKEKLGTYIFYGYVSY